MHRLSSITGARSAGLRPAQRAFTLIGVLIALAIIGIVMVAILSVAARSTQVATGLQQRNLANWVAQNRIARLRIARDWPETGTSSGTVSFARQQWRYQVEVSKTTDKALRRVTVSVSLADQPDDVITRLVGFIGRQASGFIPLPAPGQGKSAQGGSGA